jgi:hypothetical protein
MLGHAGGRPIAAAVSWVRRHRHLPGPWAAASEIFSMTSSTLKFAARILGRGYFPHLEFFLLCLAIKV